MIGTLLTPVRAFRPDKFLTVVIAAMAFTETGWADEPDSAVPGYVREVPPESASDKEVRHRAVAARRAGTIVMVHRGASDFAPENTVEAFAAAMDHGADGCEIDIHRSTDGVLYLHHDDELGRVFTGVGPVNRLTYFELLREPLTKAFGTAGADTRIPTLASLLILARQRAMLLHLDIKEPGLDDDISALIEASDTWDHVVHVNAYNSEKLRTDSRLKLFNYKGWDHEAGETEAAQKEFLSRPAQMVFAGGSPAKALKLIGRAAPAKPVPLPDGLRIQWTKDGPVAANPGWRTLFNGRDFEGWTSRGSARWRVENGVIAGGQDGDPKRSGLLLTKEHFKDFELELDFMIDEHGKYNSGVYLRNDPGSGGRTGYQINIGRGAAEEFCAGLYTDRWLDKGDEDDSIRKKLDWNKLHILAKGPHIEATLNEVKVVDFTDSAPPEKFLQKGTIAFQTYGAEGHAGWVKFRNVRIREVP